MTIRPLLAALVLYCGRGLAQNPPPSLTTVFNFTGGGDGGNPNAPLLIGSGGVLYGTTYWGGAKNCGAVFSLTPPATPGGTWTEALLYSFQCDEDGANPNTRLVLGNGGVLYGTTYGGGYYETGTAFSLTPPASPGGAWTKAKIYNFYGSFPPNGYGPDPANGLLIGPAGVLYGSALYGGGSDFGCVFALAPPASQGKRWGERTIYCFEDGGVFPQVSWNPHVVLGGDGLLYGTTRAGGDYGGQYGDGTVLYLKFVF